MRESILRMVMYFDVFKHPLTIGDLERLVAPDQATALQGHLMELQAAGLVACTGKYWHRPDRHDWASRRDQRARWAEQRWSAAQKASLVLAQLPFVRGVLITGSLSKSSTTLDGDVDFLLLCAPGRVWSLKTITHLGRRPMPNALRELFCTNYILATDAMHLESRNLFTAIELATAVPMYGPEACASFIQANWWAEQFVPGLSWSLQRAQQARSLPGKPWLKPVGKMLPDGMKHRLERQALDMWDRYWNRKYNWLDERDRAQRFQRQPHVATNHLHDFQDHVLREVAQRLESIGQHEAVRL